MALSKEQREARKGKLTASAVGLLMEGDDAKIYNLWCELTDHPDYTKESLDDVWPVQLGSHTELLSLNWYSRTKGYGPLIKKAVIETDENGSLVVTHLELYPENPIKSMGDLIVHPQYDWAAATLDAYDSKEGVNLVVECKHCGNFRKEQDIITKYMPQLHWQMFVKGTKEIILRVIIGANEPKDIQIAWDDFYWATLWDRAQKFWEQVKTKTPPARGQQSVGVVFEPSKYRTIDLDKDFDNHNWSGDMVVQLDIWIETQKQAERNDKAKAEIKKILPADVGTLIHIHEEGKGRVKVKRNKAGAVSIEEA